MWVYCIITAELTTAGRTRNSEAFDWTDADTADNDMTIALILWYCDTDSEMVTGMDNPWSMNGIVQRQCFKFKLKQVSLQLTSPSCSPSNVCLCWWPLSRPSSRKPDCSQSNMRTSELWLSFFTPTRTLQSLWIPQCLPAAFMTHDSWLISSPYPSSIIHDAANSSFINWEWTQPQVQ